MVCHGLLSRSNVSAWKAIALSSLSERMYFEMCIDDSIVSFDMRIAPSALSRSSLAFPVVSLSPSSAS